MDNGEAVMRFACVALVMMTTAASAQDRRTTVGDLKALCASKMVAMEGRCVGYIEGVIRTVALFQKDGHAPKNYCPRGMQTIVVGGIVAASLKVLEANWDDMNAEEYVVAVLESQWPCKPKT